MNTVGSVKWVMKKWSLRNRLRLNLENCRYDVWWQLTPPLTAHKSNALSTSSTAKNSGTGWFLRLGHSIVAWLLCAIKGKSLRDGWVVISGSESRNRLLVLLGTSASAGLSVTRGRWVAATCQACCRHFPDALLCWEHDSCCADAVWCFLASNFPHFHRYDSLKSALYIHAVSKNINTFPKNQGRIRAAIAVEILDFTVMYR